MTAVTVYQFRVYLREISPMIWRRLLLRSDQTLADLHYALQIAFDWDDYHLHQFLIHGRRYGVPRRYGPWYTADARTVHLGDIPFRLNERFRYEYSFFEWWQHEIRLETKQPLEPEQAYPHCIGGARQAPEETCGGAWQFMALQDHYHPGHIIGRLLEIAEAGNLTDHREELRRLQYWLTVHRFDRRAVNHRLQLYAAGDEQWRERKY